MRTPAPCTTHASCTDDTENDTDGTHRAGITWRAIPRTIPRTHHGERYAALPCAERAPPSGAADNDGAPRRVGRQRHRALQERWYFSIRGARPAERRVPRRLSPVRRGNRLS